MGGTPNMSVIFTWALYKMCTGEGGTRDSQGNSWQKPEGHSQHGRDQSASEEMYGCADFLSAGTPEAVSGSRAKRLNPEYFETSEDKPCSDPWLNSQLYSRARITGMPGSETMAAINGKDYVDGCGCCCCCLLRHTTGQSWWLVLKGSWLLYN